MKIEKRLIILGLLLLMLTMVMATQYAVTKIGYTYAIVHPSEGNIRYIGSDNSSDNVRILRLRGSNNTNVSIVLRFGNFTTGTNNSFSAAFGIVNDEPYNVYIS